MLADFMDLLLQDREQKIADLLPEAARPTTAYRRQAGGGGPH